MVVAAVTSGCSLSSGIPARTGAQPITVLGASSLQAALTTAGREYGTYHPGSSVTLGFDASSALRAKIEQGAEVDLFASADVENAQKLIEDGFAIGPAQRFTSNGLAIVVPADNPAHIRMPADLAKQGVRLVAAADGVPITAYAEQLIGALAGEAGYPPDYVKRVAANVASREDNVAAVLAKVALGEGDAGIVYRTDALASSSVREIPLPAGVNVSVTYAAVIIKASRQPDAARAFLAWLSGPAGQAILARYGFSPPP